MSDSIHSFELTVTIQENGIVRDPQGWIVGRVDKDWEEERMALYDHTRADDAPEPVESGEADSREELEADVLKRVKEGFITYTELIGWLDRQKRITIREHQEGCKYKAKADELQERVDSLTAERDLLDQAYTAVGEACTDAETECGCLQDKVDELTAELERKQHVCDVQRESFLKLEAENAELRSASKPYQTQVSPSREVGA